MTIILMLGRRVPKAWFRRQAHTIGNLISFQEHLWMMIKQSINMAKKRANQESDLVFNVSMEHENEGLNTRLEWLKVVIQGTEEQEASEYADIQNFYKPFGKLFKKDIDFNEASKAPEFFKTKMLNMTKLDDAYKNAYGCISDKNIANKMLELGIMMFPELIKDYNKKDRSIDIMKIGSSVK